MNRRMRRRILSTGLFLLLAAAAVTADAVLSVLHFRTSFISGWGLLALIVLLAAYNVRKKLNYLPLASSSSWLQLHIYAGLLTAVLFGLHVEMRIPNGGFEIAFASFYGGTFLSGVIGLFLSRTIPARLTERGEEVLFERIPVYVARLRDEVETLVFKCVDETGTTAVPELYLSHLKSWFEQPRHALWHLAHSSRPRETLLLEVRNQRRFLSDNELPVVDQIVQHVRVKDDLDYQYALQGTLKLWFFVHIPLTWGLLIFAAFHVLAVYAYGGGS